MWRMYCICATAIALSGCAATLPPEPTISQAPAQPLNPGTPPKPAAVAALKAEAAKSLKDAPSARWERLQQSNRPNQRGEPTDVICGYVNSKNSYGGYTGPKPFVFLLTSTPNLVISGEGSEILRPVMAKIVADFCVGLI